MRSKKILIVDDNKELLDELKDMLSATGYCVSRAENSAMALKSAFVTKPDLVLLDLRMPRTSGFEIAHVLKSINETRNTPIIAMTGFEITQADDYLFNYCGILKCLKKPLKPIELLSTIEWSISKNNPISRITRNLKRWRDPQIYTQT